MSKFSINTSQNVQLSFEIADLGKRILATLIDTLIMGVYVALIIWISYKLEVYEFFESSYGETIALIIYLIAAIPIMFYALLFEYFMNGQSPGKYFLKLRVAKIDNSQVGLSSYLFRWLFRMIDIWTMYGVVGIMTIAFNKRGQRLGDILANTTVIRLDRPVTIQDTIYIKLPADYKPVFEEVKTLSEEDARIIHKVLSGKEYLKDHDIVNRLAEKVATKLGVERKNLQSRTFLKVVMKDYNYYG